MRDSGCVTETGLKLDTTIAIVEYGFAELGLNRVEAYQMLRNAPSGRVLSRLRFRVEGPLRSRVIKWGAPSTCVCGRDYGLTDIAFHLLPSFLSPGYGDCRRTVPLMESKAFALLRIDDHRYIISIPING